MAEGVAVRAGDCVAVVATVLAIVGAIIGTPCHVVERAVETLRDGIVGKDVGVEEGLFRCQFVDFPDGVDITYAGLIITIGIRVLAVVLSLGRASGSTSLWVITLALAERKELGSDERVVASAVKRRVDGTA